MPEGLVERTREIAELEGHVREALAGAGRLVVVEGAAGIGKSRLLAEAARIAAGGGATVLSARGSDLEREFPFGVVRQLFEGALADSTRREAALAGPAAAAAAVFGEVEAGTTSFAALHGLYWLTLNLASTPLALVIDDLHWVDAPSLRFLAYLAQRVDGVPVLVLTGLRSGESGVDELLVAELAGSPTTAVVRPGALSPDAVSALVAAGLGAQPDPAFAAEMGRATGGNPLLVNSVIAALAVEGVKPDAAGAGAIRDVGPRAVARSVLLRLARLPAGAVAVARAVSVLGEADDPTVVAQLAGVTEREVAEAARALARADILTAETPLAFMHPLVRDAVYLDASPVERGDWHAQAARILAAGGAGGERVAGQLLATLPRGDAWVVERLRDAAALAVHRGASDGSVAYLRRALEEPPPEGQRAELLRALGEAEAGAAAPEAIERLRAALALEDDPVQRAQTAFLVCHVETFSGNPAAGWAVAHEAAAALPDGHPLAAEVEAYALAAEWSVTLDPALTERGAGLLGAHPASPGAMVLSAFGLCHRGEDRDRCAELTLQALATGLFAVDSGGFLSMPAWTTLLYADRPDALPVMDAALADARRSGSWFFVNAMDVFRGFGLRLTGELEEAEPLLRAGREAMQRLHPRFATYGAGLLAGLLAERGAVEEAAKMLAEAPPAGDRAHASMYWQQSRLVTAEASGDAAELIAAAEAVRRDLPDIRNPAVLPWRSALALGLRGAGREDEAEPWAREELALTDRWGAPGPLARALRTLGLVTDDRELLEQAVLVAERSTHRLELVRSLLALGAALRRERKPTDAREPLRRALELADRHGAAGLAAEARTELRAAGVRPRTSAQTGVAALTGSERRVADLAAAGRTNREIAQELFVTPKTVEVHLSAVYRKLGIASRRALAPAFDS